VPVRVVIAEDNLLVREGLRALLAAEPEIDLLAACADAEELLGAVEELDPDVVIVDIRMPPTNTDEGIRAAEAIRRSHPRTGVVVLSQYPEPRYALALLAGGSSGRAFLLKERLGDAESLLSAVRAVARGGSVLDPELVDLLVRTEDPSAGALLATLTRRERDVLVLMAQGRSNAAIAEALTITERAVQKYVGAIFLKLDLTWDDDVSRRVKAVLIFLAA
jgi:DNA-binding NarL/FixJ family response regulator